MNVDWGLFPAQHPLKAAFGPFFFVSRLSSERLVLVASSTLYL